MSSEGSSEDLSSEASVFYLSSEAIGFYLSLPKVLLKTCLRKLVSCNIYYKDYLKGGFASSVLIFQQSPSGLMKPNHLMLDPNQFLEHQTQWGKNHENVYGLSPSFWLNQPETRQGRKKGREKGEKCSLKGSGGRVVVVKVVEKIRKPSNEGACMGLDLDYRTKDIR
ncbi:hypothetical protein E3N88_12000 [Mikania micrantha]|uniref:Uncharacterized protein n=1 Tax=Mikania micrantha TaxID=192012 RepID=A0A5N6P612_9ASTR|nr:hypothetical protein E3N88_12000 [Mikania micrantha]